MEQLSLQVEPSDSSYMPSLVAVLGGSTVGGLKELKQITIPSSAREFVLLSGTIEVRGGGGRGGGGGELGERGRVGRLWREGRRGGEGGESIGEGGGGVSWAC